MSALLEGQEEGNDGDSCHDEANDGDDLGDLAPQIRFDNIIRGQELLVVSEPVDGAHGHEALSTQGQRLQAISLVSATAWR